VNWIIQKTTGLKRLKSQGKAHLFLFDRWHVSLDNYWLLSIFGPILEEIQATALGDNVFNNLFSRYVVLGPRV
jgi:hypothetical protein